MKIRILSPAKYTCNKCGYSFKLEKPASVKCCVVCLSIYLTWTNYSSCLEYTFKDVKHDN